MMGRNPMTDTFWLAMARVGWSVITLAFVGSVVGLAIEGQYAGVVGVALALGAWLLFTAAIALEIDT